MQHRATNSVLLGSGNGAKAVARDWQQTVSEVFVNCRIASSSRFRGEVSNACAGALRVSRVATTRHRAVRTIEQVFADRRAVVLINLIVSGCMRVRQDGREAEIRRGEFAIHDSTRPYTLAFEAPCSQIIFQLPRELLATRIGSFERYTAVCVPGSTGMGRVASHFLADTFVTCPELESEGLGRLSLMAVDLLAMALVSSVPRERTAGISSHRSALLYRAKAFIAMHLREQLKLAGIATELGISTRYLCSVFADEHLTPGRYILEQRLEGSRRMLRYGPENIRISEIGYASGFSSAAHFCHSFRARFGMSPKEYRHQLGRK